MKRRSFLRSAAAVPFVGFDPTVFAQQASSSAGEQVGVIPAGKDLLSEEHSRGYSSILFKVLPRETSNGLFVIEHVNLVNGGPPLHKHLNQEEFFYVISGQVRFALGDRQFVLGPGDSVLGPRGIPHTFAAVEGKASRLLISFSPAGKMEEFLRVTAVPNPPMQDATFWSKYEMELVGPSPFAG